ncbi:MAG: YbgC/FadM family acyl-CoA thioesterase [Thermodesulfobacteriota bacterium]
MKPKPMRLTPLDNRSLFFRDSVTGLVWHQTTSRVLYADTDRSGAVYHSHYLRYFEQGRTALMRDLDHPYRQVEESGYIYPVIKTGLDYYDLLTYDDVLGIFTRPGLLERVRVTFNYVITKSDNPRIVCQGFTQHCALNQARVPVAVDALTLQAWRCFPR